MSNVTACSNQTYETHLSYCTKAAFMCAAQYPFDIGADHNLIHQKHILFAMDGPHQTQKMPSFWTATQQPRCIEGMILFHVRSQR